MGPKKGLPTFLRTRSSAGVLGVLPDGPVGVPRAEEAGVVLELGVDRIPLSTPNGVRGGEVTHGLQSK